MLRYETRVAFREDLDVGSRYRRQGRSVLLLVARRSLQQLRDELNALKTANQVAKAHLARQGAEQLERFRRE